MKSTSEASAAAIEPGNIYNDSSLNKEDETFVKSKTSVFKTSAVKDGKEMPAPFYDELHYADYE